MAPRKIEMMRQHNEPKGPEFSLAGCFCCFRSEISASAGLSAADILDLGLSGGRNNSEFLAVPLGVSAEKSRRTRGFGSRRFCNKERHRANNTISANDYQYENMEVWARTEGRVCFPVLIGGRSPRAALANDSARL
jgi:hypothetical protein